MQSYDDFNASPSTSGASRTIDLRSDTVTRPTPGMLEAMVQAPLGDDVWGDDPTVNRLQVGLEGKWRTSRR